MMKRILNMILCAALALSVTASLAACGGKPGQESTPASQKAESRPEEKPSETKTEPSDAQPVPEKLAEILVGEGKHLGAIDAASACSAVNGGVFYSVVNMKEYALTGTASYRFFRAADGKDVLLGTLEGQSYEAFYARTELDGAVYALATEGDPFDDRPDTLWLLAFDLAAESMTKHEVTKYGFPYAAMAAAGGKLLILNHEMSSPKSDKVYEYDPAAGTVREILSLPDDGTSSLRSIAAAEDGFYLLRLALAGGLPEEMLLDRYDGAGELQESVSLNGMIVPAMKDLPGFTGEDDVLIEFGLNAGGFAVQDGRYLFYENFGRIRVSVDLMTGEALFADEDLWSMTNNGGEPAFFELAFVPYDAGEGPKIVYLQDGKLQTLPFRPDDGSLLLRSASRSADGTWLIRMTSDGGAEKIFLWQEK